MQTVVNNHGLAETNGSQFLGIEIIT